MTLYLSSLLINPEHTQARRDLARPYDLHRTLGHVFPGPRATHDQKGRDNYELHHGMLYRVEEPEPHGVPVLVQSVTKPDWIRLPQGYTTCLNGPKEFTPYVAKGQHLRFRLVANPVRRVRPEGKKHPRRRPLVHPRAKEGIETGYLDWLERQAQRAGFTVLHVVDAPSRQGYKRCMERDPGQIGPIPKEELPHFGVRFDGVLHVTDPDALNAAVRNGIGPAKAFGFGLLSLAPL